MLNYFNFKKIKDQYLLTNDFGRYVFLDHDDFNCLLSGEFKEKAACLQSLKDNLFLYDDSHQSFVARTEHLLRDSKNYVFSPTSLHIFVVTTLCNMRCVYCQATDEGMTTGSMDFSTAEHAVDIALSAPAQHLTFEFQGGEPLLNFDTIKHIVHYTNEKRGKKTVTFNLVSNLTVLNDEVIDFIKRNHIGVSTSLDGDSKLHNWNRPYHNGGKTYLDVTSAIKRLQREGIRVGAIQTTTKESLNHACELVDTYCSLGLNNIFIRPLTPLGCAKKRWREIGYTPKEFIRFYCEAFQCILDKCRSGYRLQEGFATTLFSKILRGYPVNYMELRSPCGASLGQLAYYTNGDVFTCDEGRMIYEMGDDSFCLGNVFENDYNDLMNCSTCKATSVASITESIPGCCDCVYQPYCGVCPVVNMALYGDVLPKTPNHYRCEIYKGILDFLFELLQEKNAETINILRGWYN